MKMKKLLQTALLAAIITSLVPVISQAEVTYEEQDSGTNMGQSFTGSATVTYGQTPSFTVKIPKSITLDSKGTGKYAVGVKGQIPSKYIVNVVPDETITMEEENDLLNDIIANVTAEKTTWTATELAEDSYTESTDNTIQMQSIDFAKFKGILNFNVSAEVDDSIKVGSEADLENFTYSLNDSTNVITLTKYANGTKSEVVIYGKYEVSGKVYDTEMTNGKVGSDTQGIFYNDLNGSGNNVITSIVFKPGVKAVGNCQDMFSCCENLVSIDFSGLDTSEVTNMYYMFGFCSSLAELDLTSFETSKVTNMQGMFLHCSSLTSIKVSSATWVEPENKDDMFEGCGVSSVTKV